MKDLNLGMLLHQKEKINQDSMNHIFVNFSSLQFNFKTFMGKV